MSGFHIALIAIAAALLLMLVWFWWMAKEAPLYDENERPVNRKDQ